MKKKNFVYNLAVTPLRKYYDKDSKNIFLKKSLCDNLNNLSNKRDKDLIYKYRISNSYVKSKAKFLKRKKKLYLKQISKILNNYHKTKYNQKYWSIILDSWLIHLISAIIVRIDELKNLKKYKKNLSIISNNNKYYFDDCGKLFSFIGADDDFNQSIYSKIAYYLKIKSKPEIKNIKKIINIKSPNKNLKKKFFYKILNLYVKLFSPTLLVDSYFIQRIKLFFHSLGKILILPSSIFDDFYQNEIDLKFRKSLCIKENDEFDKIFNIFIKDLLPKSFLENYLSIKKNIKNISQKTSKVGTSVGIHISDPYKILAADLYLRRKKYLGFQHGSYYGLQTLNLLEEVEKSNCSKYYYWNNKKGLGLNYLPSFKIMDIKQIKKNTDIVLYMSIQKKYNNRIEFQMDYSDNYKNYKNYFDFFDNLNEQSKKNFVLKPLPKSNWWNNTRFWETRYKSNIKILRNINSKNTLKKTKIFVASQISTPFIEALYVGVPIFIFVKLNEYSYKPHIQKIFLRLKKIGIIHDNPESCAKFINKRKDDLFDWWLSPKVKKEVKKIRNLLFSNNKGYLKEILSELKT